ncbi:MAG: nitrilase-related carbon-nitrogen hydrolase [Candidatus Eisenbacteria bacterium]
MAEPVPVDPPSGWRSTPGSIRWRWWCPSTSGSRPACHYNTAAVYDADGSYLGKYRKNHIPHTSGFWEKYFFKPETSRLSVFETRYGKGPGSTSAAAGISPRGARLLGLNGAEIVFNPSATVAGLSQYLWKLEQPAHAVANGYFMACSNRVRTEAPWNIGRFYGSRTSSIRAFLATGSETRRS